MFRDREHKGQGLKSRVNDAYSRGNAKAWPGAPYTETLTVVALNLFSVCKALDRLPPFWCLVEDKAPKLPSA